MNEAQKKSVMTAILAFNVTFVLYTFIFNYPDFALMRMLLGLLLGAGAAAGGYFAAKMFP